MITDSGILPRWLVWTTGILGLVGAVLMLVVRYYQIQEVRTHAQATTTPETSERENRWNREPGRRPSRDRENENEVALFDGKSLSGWTSKSGNPASSWLVQNGALANISGKENLFSIKEFKNFRLELEYQLPKDGMAGLFLRGRYEIQLVDTTEIARTPRSPFRYASVTTQGSQPPKGFPSSGLVKWHRLEVTMVGDDVTVQINGETVLEGSFERPSRGALFNTNGPTGPIMLQAENGHGLKFRNLRITPIEEASTEHVH